MQGGRFHHHYDNAHKLYCVSPLGLEPRTRGLKGRCSAIELGTRKIPGEYSILKAVSPKIPAMPLAIFRLAE